MAIEKKMNETENVFDTAKQATASMRELRILRAEREDRGWRLKYITIDDGYPIAAIERSLTRQIGEAVRMVNLHYDFDTAARLICA